MKTLFLRFLAGVALGLGFGVGVLAVGGVGLGWMASRAWPDAVSIPLGSGTIEPMGGHTSNFHELPIEEQIERSSAIVLAKFEKAEDGAQKAIVTDVLKLKPGTVFHYKVGDEYPDGRRYPRQEGFSPEGLVVFFEGSPASTRMSMTFSGDRIGSLGDMPMALFKQKCAKSGTHSRAFLATP